MEGLRYACIWNLVTSMLVAVEEAVSVAQFSEHMDLADSVELESQGVKDESSDWVEAMASIVDVELVEDERPASVYEDPEMGLPVW